MGKRPCRALSAAGLFCASDEPGSHHAAGENIAMGNLDADAVCDGWYNSPGHRANVLNE